MFVLTLLGFCDDRWVNIEVPTVQKVLFSGCCGLIEAQAHRRPSGGNRLSSRSLSASTQLQDELRIRHLRHQRQ
ncbi:hypothetical protein BIW11_04451 [Tropilaelaps mercedesae]|uniref:Uncharacterized protein n=1 Tax=Tropilaelaps mercedesae TaxID=418985 RepID=A0A1V9X6C1_9ACAR|nr:hypothetical protein BIW11_04451 [Tropilaelaps mercedesae]